MLFKEVASHRRGIWVKEIGVETFRVGTQFLEP